MSSGRIRAVRRIVTGHHADGRSTVVMDGPAPNVKQRQAGNGSTLLWVTDESPAQVSGRSDRAAREIVVLEGEIHLLLDDGEHKLQAGDVVVQQGTNHSWINRGAATCRLAMVFMDALEPSQLQGRA